MKKVSIGILIFSVLFSVIACLSFGHSEMGSMHHNTVPFQEHSTHIQLLTLATVPTPAVLHLATTFFVFALLLLGTLITLKISFSLTTFLASLYRKKLERILFSLRSPPLSYI